MSTTPSNAIPLGLVVPGKPHPYLAADQNEGWARLRAAFERAAELIEASGAERLLLYSTQWPSILGHQVQAHPAPTWVHVDPEWHALGEISYSLRMDPAFADAYVSAAQARGLHARTVSYEGFPIDTGSIVALSLLNPGNRLPASIVSCNMYADRAETLVLGKAAADAIDACGGSTAVVAVTALSHRMFAYDIDPADDQISSLKDDEWNRKLLEFFAEGRLEDVSQLAREFSQQANGDQRLKAIWWLAATMGQHNRYDGDVMAYEPIWGTGAAVVSLHPSATASADKEFDEDDVEVFAGERQVLTGEPTEASSHERPPLAPTDPDGEATRSVAIRTTDAPDPVGAYPHARRTGDLIYLSGIGPRQAGTDAIPGGPIRDAAGNPVAYDAAAQTEAVIANIRTILEASGSSLDRIIDVSTFLVDMQRDFEAYNAVYAKHFTAIQATRTTVEVRALPTPIAVEMKVVATVAEGGERS